MRHKLAGCKVETVLAHKQGYEQSLAAEIIPPDKQENAGNWTEQIEGGTRYFYKIVDGYYVPLLDKQKGNNVEFANNHYKDAWGRFEVFLKHPVNTNLRAWAEYFKDKKNPNIFMITELYQEICRRFEFFHKYYGGIDGVHNLFDLFRQAVPSSYETVEIIERRMQNLPVSDRTVSADTKPQDVADLILKRSTEYEVGEAAEDLLVLMVAFGYLSRSMIHSHFIQGKPTDLTNFQYEVLHHAMAKLAERGGKIMFTNSYLDAEDFVDTLDEIRSEIQKAAMLATPGGAKLIQKGLVTQNKSVKRVGVCECNDKLRDFFLDDVIARDRLGSIGRGHIADVIRSQWKDICLYANRAAIFPMGTPEQMQAKKEFEKLKLECEVTFKLMPARAATMYQRTVEIMEFMINTEYKLPRSTTRVRLAYMDGKTSAVVLPTTEGTARNGGTAVAAAGPIKTDVFITA